MDDKVRKQLILDELEWKSSIGKVRAWFERDIIEWAAWAAPGVKSIDDRVTICS